tara:strand:- start:23770 stop:29397 length:5628 start_codon:yes stop_codon:yes gene_type:complete
MENRTLKMEAVERDRKLKQSLARLARAEETAKRASMGSASARAPLKGDSNASRLFAAEQRAAELEEEARELTRKLQKEMEKGLHYKNMNKELKVKLDEALKSARMKKPGQRSPSAVFPGQTSSMEDKLKDMLRQERARAAALAEERDELRKAVHASDGKMPKPAAPAAPASPKKDSNEWILEDFTHEGRTYLLDRATMKVYDKPAPEDWPEPVGRLVGGCLLMAKNEDLFKALDSYLKREQIHLKRAFDRFDSDGNEYLDGDELGKFLEAVMPGVTAAQQRYFCAMCDTNNDGKITYMELVESMKSCIRIGEEVADHSSVEVLDVLKRIRDHIDGPNILSTVSAVFHRFDADNSGTLENRELLSMVEVLVPDVKLEEKRFLLALVAKLDLDGDGKISMAELWKAIRAVKPTIAVDAAAPVASPKPAKKSSARPTPAVKAAEAIKSSPKQLVLKEHVVKGKMFLLDAKKNYVYDMLSSPEGWLKPLGKILNGAISKPATSADLVATLDGTLKKQKTRLKDVFDKFDTNKDGVLEESELSGMLKVLMPGSGAADLGFFLLLLDTNRDARIEYEELVSCIKEIIVASQAFNERGNMYVERLLLKLKAVVRDDDRGIRSAFGRVGKLSYAKAFDVLRNLVSNDSAQDYRFLTCFLRRLDQDNTGAVGIDDISYALRVLDVVFVATDGVSPSVNVPQPRQGDADEWYLEDITLNGQSYLVDRHTTRVYTRATGRDSWPQLTGSLRGGKLVPIERKQQHRFVTGLDNYLKLQQSRLKDIFDTFNRDGTGALDKAEISSLIRALVPDVSNGNIEYFSALLDIDCDGEVTYDEFVKNVRNAVAEGSSTTSVEVTDVLKTLREYLETHSISLMQAFDQFDSSKTGYLTHSSLMSMCKILVPTLGAAELKLIANHLHSLDMDGEGRVTVPSLYQSFQASTVKVVGGSAMVLHPTADQAAWSFNKRTNRHPVAQASEVAALRKQLNEAQARCAELDRALKKEQQSALPMPGSAGHVTSYSTSELQGEIKSAWERAGLLQRRYHEAQSALGTMKANHTRVLQQLDDTHKRLNQERKENLKLSAEEKRLAMELEAAREIEPALEQSRRERAALEKENHQLLATAMTAPGESQSEMRKLRSLMAEAQRERADAELREVELRRTIQTIGNNGLEEAANTRAERDRLRMNCGRMEVELEAANEKIGVLMDMSRSALENNAMNNTQVAVVDDGMDEGSLRAELRGLRETFGDQVQDLRKTQRLLQLEEQQVDDLRAALTEEKTRADKMNEGLFKKVKAHENELDRRQKRIHALEAQLRSGIVAEKPKAQTIRTSQDGADVASEAAVDALADLAPGENIFELQLMSVEVDGAKIGEENPATFMTVDFFEHETQATAVQQGLSVNTKHTLQYIVKADDFFLEYLDTKRLPVELNKSLGMDFATIGVANLNLSWVLDDAIAGKSAESPAEHFCDVIGRSGDVIARLRYAAYMRKSIVSDAREYRRKPPVASSVKLLRKNSTSEAYSTAHAAAAETPFSSMISIELSCCRDLVPRVGSPDAMVPYLSFQFPGLASHDTVYGRGANPDFNDVHDLPLKRTPEVEAKMVKSAMEIIAFDDADVDLEGAGVIGIGRVDLEPLSKGMPVTGSFPLFSQSRERRGTVFVSVAWKDPYTRTSPSKAGGALASGVVRVSEIRPDPTRMSQTLEEDTVFPAPASLMTSVSSPIGEARSSSAETSTSALGSTESIVVSIGQFELGKTLYHDHKVRQMFMLFEFMPKFHRDDEQQTMRVKKESQFVDFGYQKSFPVKDSGLRSALASLLKGGNPEDATIPFCLVSDDNGIDFEDVGFFELRLTDIFKNGDVLDQKVEVLDKNDVPIGRVTISVVAQQALQSIMLMQ